MRQGRSSLLTLISSGLALASHPVVSVVTRLLGLPDVATTETVLRGGARHRRRDRFTIKSEICITNNDWLVTNAL